MKTPRNAAERALYIELSRANIALSREKVAASAKGLGREMAPSHLATRFVSRTAANVRTPGWLHMAPGLLGRYPILASVAWSALSARRRHGRWWWAGTAALGGLAWWAATSHRDDGQA